MTPAFSFGCYPQLLQPTRNRIRNQIQHSGHIRSFPAPFCGLFDLFSPSSSHVEVPQPKRTQELPQLVETKGLGEDVGIPPIRQNILKFDFTGEDTLADKVVECTSMCLVRAWKTGFFANWMLLRLSQ